MLARFRLTFLCLIAIFITSAVMVFTRPVSAQEVNGSINGCFHIDNGISSPSSGEVKFNNALGEGNFFFRVRPAGQIATFNFSINNQGQIIGGNAQSDVNLLAKDGSNVFGRLDDTSSSVDASTGVVTLQGTILFFGGTRSFLGAKGSASFNATIYTKDTTINGVAVKANTADFCFDGRIRGVSAEFGPGQQTMIVFGLLFTGWIVFLLYRRKRRAQL
jgi:hypothetical protein